MAQTVSTFSQLITLYASGQNCGISAEDGRDVIASAFGWFSLASNPTVNNDSVDTAGLGAFFDVGSKWLNLTTNVVWYCFDGTPGAAVWATSPPHLTLQDSSGSPSVTDPTFIITNKNNGLSLSVTGTTAALTLLAAAAAQAGIIDDTDYQILDTGRKRFQKAIVVNYGTLSETFTSTAGNAAFFAGNLCVAAPLGVGAGGPAVVFNDLPGTQNSIITGYKDIIYFGDHLGVFMASIHHDSDGEIRVRTEGVFSVAEIDGVTGYGNAGDKFTGGIYWGSGPVPPTTLSIGATTVAGGTGSSVLFVDDDLLMQNIKLSPGGFPLGGSVGEGAFGSDFTLGSGTLSLAARAIDIAPGAGLTGGGSVSLGGTTTLSVGTGAISNAQLTNATLTVAAGSGLSGGGAVALGSSTTLSLTAGALTVDAGPGLSGGGAVSLGNTTTLSLATNALTVAAGTGLSGGGAVSLGGATTLALPTSGVSAGSYTLMSGTVDAEGRLTAASSGSAPASVQTNYLGGMWLAYESPGTYVAIAPGNCADSTNVSNLSSSVFYYKSISGTWVAGAGAPGSPVNGLDTGSVAINTWYHLFAIFNPTSKVTDFVWSATTLPSAGPSVLPSGYTLFRRIGSCKTNASSEFIQFIQQGDHFTWITPIADQSNVSCTASVLYTPTLTTPLNVETEAEISIGFGRPTGGGGFAAWSPVATGLSAYGINAAVLQCDPSGANSWTKTRLLTNTASQINVSPQASGAYYVNTFGYYDIRGKQ